MEIKESVQLVQKKKKTANNVELSFLIQQA